VVVQLPVVGTGDADLVRVRDLDEQVPSGDG